MFRPITPYQAVPDLVDGRNRPIGKPLRQWLDDRLRNHSAALQHLTLAHTISLPRYSASIAPDLSQGGIQKITVTDGNAVTIAAPVNPTGLADWSLVIYNNSGGAMGTVTFDPSILQSGFVSPANGKHKSVRFYIDGTKHVQIGSWSPDV